MDPFDTYLTIAEAGALLKLERHTIYKYIKTGKLKAVKLGIKKYLIARADLLAFVNGPGRAFIDVPSDRGGEAPAHGR